MEEIDNMLVRRAILTIKDGNEVYVVFFLGFCIFSYEQFDRQGLVRAMLFCFSKLDYRPLFYLPNSIVFYILKMLAFLFHF